MSCENINNRPENINKNNNNNNFFLNPWESECIYIYRERSDVSLPYITCAIRFPIHLNKNPRV